MPNYTATVTWTLAAEDDFPAGRYSRGHSISFDGGITLPGSASPHVVGKWAVPEAADPEELLVAALSSCHMLTFLDLARQAGFVVASYADAASGTMDEVAPGRHAVTLVTLHPKIKWSGDEPSEERLAHLHLEAHEQCFIANSVNAKVHIC